jgi:hypothetical protein
MLRAPTSPPLALALLTAALLSGCIEETQLPGDEVLGTFVLNTQPRAGSNCPAEEVPDAGGVFEGTLTRNRDGTAYFVVDGFGRDAGYDGQRLTSVQRALQPRLAAACGTGCSAVEVEQTLRLLLLSSSQNEAFGKDRSCADLLDGGLPADAGSTLPPGADGGFDAVRACGELVNQKLPDAGCSCAQCTLSFGVEGTRKATP